MAKRWSGFVPQNNLVRAKWSQLLQLQDEQTEILDFEAPPAQDNLQKEPEGVVTQLHRVPSNKK